LTHLFLLIYGAKQHFCAPVTVEDLMTSVPVEAVVNRPKGTMAVTAYSQENPGGVFVYVNTDMLVEISDTIFSRAKENGWRLRDEDLAGLSALYSDERSGTMREMV
jgi:hypothetical protein